MVVMMEENSTMVLNYTWPSPDLIQSPASTISLDRQVMYRVVVQGIFLLCLSTVVGGVMVLFICLNIMQECKLLYTWVVRTRDKEESPPSYSAATKPPSYAECTGAEGGPPEYSQVCLVGQGQTGTAQDSVDVREDVL